MKLALALVLCAGTASAAPKSPEQQIKYVVGFVCENSIAAHVNAEFFTTGATLYVSGNATDPNTGFTTGIANLHAPKAIAIELASDRKSAWFQTTCTGEATYEHSKDDCERTKAANCDARKIAFHTSGHIVDDGGWKIDTLLLTATDSNEVMYGRGDNPNTPKLEMPTKVATTGDAGLTSAVSDWFKAGDLSKAAASGIVVAAGSAPAELGMNAAAKKLVASWTKLGMALVSIDAKVDGDRGIVSAVVRFTTKKKTVIQLALTAIAVRDGETWRWRVLDFVT